LNYHKINEGSVPLDGQETGSCWENSMKKFNFSFGGIGKYDELEIQKKT